MCCHQAVTWNFTNAADLFVLYSIPNITAVRLNIFESAVTY